MSLPRDTQLLNCTRVCTSDRKGKTGLDFWWSRAATFGYPGFDLFGAERHFAVLKRRAREPNLVRSVSLNAARMLQGGCHLSQEGWPPVRPHNDCSSTALLFGLQYWRWRVVQRPGISSKDGHGVTSPSSSMLGFCLLIVSLGMQEPWRSDYKSCLS